MSATEATNNQGGNTDATPKPRKRRRWLRVLIGIVILLLALVALAPTLVSTSLGRKMVVSAVNDRIRGKVQIEDMPLGWFSTCSVDGLAVIDPQGRKTLDVKRIVLSKGLLSLVWSRKNKDLGQIDIDTPQADLYMDTDGNLSLAQAFEQKNPQPPATKQPEGTSSTDMAIVLRLNAGKVRLVNPDGVEYVVKDLAGSLRIKTLNDIVASFNGSAGDGGFSFNADIKDIFSSGKASLDTATGQIKMLTSPAIDIQPIISFCTKDVHGTGKFGVDVLAK
ncbi:MAG: hypothetical protein HQ546_06310, partial [Planctomycetes bacterium]|nr:hypothetical protein [Planctomycetota bacterium]